MIFGHDGSGKSVGLHGPNRSERVLEDDAASRRQTPRFEMAGRARQNERHKINSAIRSQHKPMHATPGGPTSRDPAHQSLESMLVSSFVCPCAVAQGSPSQNPKTPDRDNRVQGCVPITNLTPPPPPPVVPFFTPPLHALSLGSGSIACFGQVVRVAARAPANRQRGKCRTMCHPLDVVGKAWAACIWRRHQNVRGDAPDSLASPTWRVPPRLWLTMSFFCCLCSLN